jgi:hypothetical protein
MDFSMFNLPEKKKANAPTFSWLPEKPQAQQTGELSWLPGRSQVQRPNDQQLQQSFQQAHRSLVDSNVSITPLDVAREVPGAVMKHVGYGKSLVETFVPAITEGFKTAGGIFGEGIAYATSPTVRQAYEAGNLDVLPRISETRQLDVFKKTIAVGIELAVYKHIPKAIKGTRGERAGIGAIQGLGFAISEGLAKDYSAEEIMKNAAFYSPAGGLIGLYSPYLIPILRTEMRAIPTATRESFRRLWNEGAEGIPQKAQDLLPKRADIPEPEPFTPGEIAAQMSTQPVRAVDTPTAPRTVPRAVAEGGEQGVSRHYEKVKQELGALPEDVATYTKRNLDDVAKRSTAFVEQADPKEAFRIAMGMVDTPPGQDRLGINVALTAALEAAGQKETARMLARRASTEFSDIGSALNIAKLDIGSAGSRRIEAAVTIQRLEEIGRKLPSNLGETTPPAKRAQQLIKREAKEGAKEVTTSIRTAYKSADELIRALTC